MHIFFKTLKNFKLRFCWFWILTGSSRLRFKRPRARSTFVQPDLAKVLATFALSCISWWNWDSVIETIKARQTKVATGWKGREIRKRVLGRWSALIQLMSWDDSEKLKKNAKASKKIKFRQNSRNLLKLTYRKLGVSSPWSPESDKKGVTLVLK